MKIVAIVQARMGSTRLPGKVMMDLLGEPVLVRDVNRLQRSKLLNEIVIATTNLPADDRIVSLCQERDGCIPGEMRTISLTGTIRQHGHAMPMWSFGSPRTAR